MNERDQRVADEGFDKIQLEMATRHVFLCLGPKCCSEEEGGETWDVLKHQLKEAKIPVLRTKAGCLRVCAGGPWMLVYPEGIWYGQVTPERCERIVKEHLQGGRPIKEWIVRRHALE